MKLKWLAKYYKWFWVIVECCWYDWLRITTAIRDTFYHIPNPIFINRYWKEIFDLVKSKNNQTEFNTEHLTIDNYVDFVKEDEKIWERYLKFYKNNWYKTLTEDIRNKFLNTPD